MIKRNNYLQAFSTECNRIKSVKFVYVLFSLLLLATSCNKGGNEVIVYSTVDQVFSEPVLKDFETKTGIKVRAVYDTEETKSTGVMNRLITEKENPQCDVFWSGDPVRNGLLQSKEVTMPYQSEQTNLIDKSFKETDNHWIGFSARARVVIYNKSLINPDSLPKSILAFSKPEYQGKFTIANPLFGTTTFHMAAIFTVLGDEPAKNWMNAIKQNGVVMAASNGDVKRKVMNGEVAFGLTDTDDAFEAMKESANVGFVFPDQGENGIGTLVMPNAISLINGAPHSDNAKKLIDFLISRETEAKLAVSCAQMPLIKGVEVPESVPSLDKIKSMGIDYKLTSEKLENIQTWLKTWTEK